MNYFILFSLQLYSVISFNNLNHFTFRLLDSSLIYKLILINYFFPINLNEKNRILQK